jgi:hypothetical protein
MFTLGYHIQLRCNNKTLTNIAYEAQQDNFIFFQCVCGASLNIFASHLYHQLEATQHQLGISDNFYVDGMKQMTCSYMVINCHILAKI